MEKYEEGERQIATETYYFSGVMNSRLKQGGEWKLHLYIGE